MGSQCKACSPHSRDYFSFMTIFFFFLLLHDSSSIILDSNCSTLVLTCGSTWITVDWGLPCGVEEGDIVVYDILGKDLTTEGNIFKFEVTADCRETSCSWTQTLAKPCILYSVSIAAIHMNGSQYTEYTEEECK